MSRWWLVVRARGAQNLVSVAALMLLFNACTPPGKPRAMGDENQRDIMNFNVLFSSNCAACHGANGQFGPARPLNNALYLAIVPKEELVKTITYGRPGTMMPAWATSQGGPLTDQQIQALVNGMEQNWAKPVNFHGVALPSYSAGETTGNPDNGRKLFQKDCYACHGQGGAVGPVTDPSYLSLVSDQVIRTAIIEGRPDFGMPDFRILNAGKPLTDQDISDLVAFLVSQRPPYLTAQNGRAKEMGNGQTGPMTMGNKGSGNGPGSPAKGPMKNEPPKGNSSQGAGR